jgi:hypothetical protein
MVHSPNKSRPILTLFLKCWAIDRLPGNSIGEDAVAVEHLPLSIGVLIDRTDPRIANSLTFS